MINRIVLVLSIMSLSACTTEAVYSSIQAKHRNDCINNHNDEPARARCIDENYKSYDDYKKEAEIE